MEMKILNSKFWKMLEKITAPSANIFQFIIAHIF